MTRIEIEDEIAKSIDKRCEGTDFESVEEYVNYVLHEVIRQNHTEIERDSQLDTIPEEHLKDLGYL